MIRIISTSNAAFEGAGTATLKPLPSLRRLRNKAEYVRERSKCQPNSGALTYFYYCINAHHCTRRTCAAPPSWTKALIVQIYEIQTPAEAEFLIEDGVDHIGSVVLSARDWKDEKLLETVRLVQAAGKISSLIPLFSNIDDIRHVLDYYRPDIVHFCEILALDGREKGNCRDLLAVQKIIRQDYPGVRIMRSIPIGPQGQTDTIPTLALAAQFEASSDYFLTDTLLLPETNLSAAQPVDGFVGITGQPCDWQIARALVDHSRIPVILAGGLSPENVCAGIAMVAPAGVDSCTATNQRDAAGHPIRSRKDRARVREFVRAARGGGCHPSPREY